MSMTECQGGGIKLLMDEETGCCQIRFEDNAVIKNLYAGVTDGGGQRLLTGEMSNHEVKIYETKDLLGEGWQLIADHFNTKDYILRQEFCCYESGFITTRLIILAAQETKSNCMDVIWSDGTEEVLQLNSSRIRFLSAPFDNDKWAKFIDYPVEHAKMSYEFTAVHGEGEAAGMVVGSLDHDNWKTGITISKVEYINSFKVTAGVANEDTRDLDGVGHGFLHETIIASPRIFLGYFSSYQQGFQRFGECNAKIKPALPWDGPVPFGWNSWASLMGTLSYEKYQQSADFMESIKDTFCDEEGSQYINFDAGWSNFVTRMQDSVAYVLEKGQRPGSYLGPFITSPPFDREVPGTDGNYLFEDLLLRDNTGKVLEHVDGLYSLDPTHPGTLANIRYETDRIIKWGFQYIKADFLGHGCREGNFYNKEITTGVQAYHYGMKYFTDCLSVKQAGYPIFISLSIDPIFPHGYGHARRISCDAFGSLDQSEYLNNCITYLWWMNDCLYRFNDPDHIVIYKTYDKHSTTLEEGRTRLHTGIICGTLMINSDDYSIEAARKRAELLLTNKDLNQLAAKGVSFRPVSGNFGEHAADVFMRDDGDSVVAALFNYSISDEKTVTVPFTLLGIPAEHCVCIDLWSKKKFTCEKQLNVTLMPAQSAIIKIIK